VFLPVKANLLWLNDVSDVYFVQVSLLLIGQQSLGTFLQISTLVSHWLDYRRKVTNTNTISAIQAASQSTFINEKLYSTCDWLQ
jgi:hypothetical protein